VFVSVYGGRVIIGFQGFLGTHTLRAYAQGGKGYGEEELIEGLWYGFMSR